MGRFRGPALFVGCALLQVRVFPFGLWVLLCAHANPPKAGGLSGLLGCQAERLQYSEFTPVAHDNSKSY